MAEPTKVSLATATPGGGFPFFGDNAAAVINETDKSLNVETKNTKGSAENIGLLGAEGEYDAIPWFWSDQHDLCLQIAGLVDEGCETVELDLGEGAL